jgi:tetratricopeptide (TPR) repeat protein
MAHANFAASLETLGQYDRAASEARDALRLMPMLGVGSYYSLLLALTDGNRLEEAKLVFAEALAREADTPVMHHMRHLIAFLEHDEVAMQEQLEWMRNAKDPFAAQADADVHSYYGQFREARRILRNGNGPVVHFPEFRPDIMIQEVEAGETADAERIARNFVPLQQDRMLPLLLALTYARTGNVAEAEKIVQEIDREFPHNTIVQYYSLPTIRAAVRLHERDAAGAIEILRPAKKYELANPDPFNSLYPAYIRGLAYLQMSNGRSAAAEFQKLLDHPAIMGGFVTGALAHLQLGRAQAMMGDKDAARNSYRDFLNLWKNADPDIPVLKQAKAEYAGLR